MQALDPIVLLVYALVGGLIGLLLLVGAAAAISNLVEHLRWRRHRH